MEEKKEFLKEWSTEDSFQTPIENKKNVKELLKKKHQRPGNAEPECQESLYSDDHKSSENNKPKMPDEKTEKRKADQEEENINEIVIEDAADLTDEQKLKSNKLFLFYFKIFFF